MPSASSTPGWMAATSLVKELKDHVRHEVGPIAIPAKIEFVDVVAQDAQRQDHAPPAQGANHSASRLVTRARWKAK